ncbi:hypothetical protein JW960_05740 [candidate division KSB1 bacterium]|nr:hypothetical protein [candidate division KSB1 bacterium]
MVKIGNKLYVKIGFIVLWLGIFNPVIRSFSQVSLRQTTGYDKNIFRDDQGIADWTHQTSFTAVKKFVFVQMEWDVAYNGQAIWFNQHTDRFFHVHQFDTQANIQLPHQISLENSFVYDQRFNKDDYTLYEYRNWRLSPQLHFLHFQQTPLVVGYYLRQRHYNELDYLNYTEQNAFFTIKHFFPTRTTVIANINLYWKNYSASTEDQQVIIQRKAQSPDGGSGNAGGGHGHGQPHGPTDPLSPQEMMMDTLITTIHQTQQRSTQRWEASVRIAQSLTNSTGLRFDWTGQYASDTPIRYLSGQEYNYTDDDELYDNPYNYNGNSWEVMITQLLPLSFQLKCFANTSQRRYNYSPEDMTTNRKDDELIFGVDVNKSFALPLLGLRTNLTVSYQYIKNESNDYYFDYAFPLIFVSAQFTRN